LDRMLGAKSTVKVYARGKSDSALPKDWTMHGPPRWEKGFRDKGERT
jgi:hypothetical protein